MVAPTTGTGSLDRLRDYAAAGRSGELIVATENVEVHVYLQRGRVAWATSSRARFAFTRHLMRACGIDRDTVRHAVEECQRTRKPFGETLVAWKLASEDDVRAALKAQVTSALADLLGAFESRDVFLDRDDAFREYARELTFDVGDLIGEVERTVALPDRGDGGLTKVMEAVVTAAGDDLLWAVAVRGDVALAKHAAGVPLPGAEVRELLAVCSSEPGSRFAVLAEGCAFAAGVPVAGEGTSLWAAARGDADVGKIKRALERASGIPTETAFAGEQSEPWESIRHPAMMAAARPLEAALASTPEVGAAFLWRSPDEEPTVVRRRSFTLEPHISIAARRSGTLLARRADPLFGPETWPDGYAWDGSVAYRLAVGDHWHCAVVRTAAPRFAVWLVLRGRGALAIGQAVTDSLARQVSELLVDS